MILAILWFISTELLVANHPHVVEVTDALRATYLEMDRLEITTAGLQMRLFTEPHWIIAVQFIEQGSG